MILSGGELLPASLPVCQHQHWYLCRGSTRRFSLCCNIQSPSPVPHFWRWLLMYWTSPSCIFAHTEYLPDFGKMDFINFPHSMKGIKENASIRINKGKFVCLFVCLLDINFLSVSKKPSKILNIAPIQIKGQERTFPM